MKEATQGLTFGSRLQLYRHRAKLTQTALARLMGWDSQSRISMYERGEREPSNDEILKFCSVLNCTPNDLLLGGEPAPSGSKEFVLFGSNEYQGELSMALIEAGFQIKPIAITGQVTEEKSATKQVEMGQESATQKVQYGQAGARFGLSLSVSHQYQNVCVFSDGHVVTATVQVMDLQTNDVLQIIKQSGPDKECPPLTPVWQLLAQELSKTWR